MNKSYLEIDLLDLNSKMVENGFFLKNEENENVIAFIMGFYQTNYNNAQRVCNDLLNYLNAIVKEGVIKNGS